jgi:hypothetical protein
MFSSVQEKTKIHIILKAFCCLELDCIQPIIKFCPRLQKRETIQELFHIIHANNELFIEG